MSVDTKNDIYLEAAYKAIDDKFGEDIVILDIHDVSALADYFIVATGRNSNHNKAIADEVSEKLRKAGLVQKHVEGYGRANWILLDFSNIIVHIFDEENRRFYNIERVWGDAPAISAEQFARER